MSFLTSFWDFPQKEQHRFPLDSSRLLSTFRSLAATDVGIIVSELLKIVRLAGAYRKDALGPTTPSGTHHPQAKSGRRSLVGSSSLVVATTGKSPAITR